MAEGSIKVIHGMMDEDGEDIILRGVIDSTSLSRLRIDDYQREQLGPKKIAEIMAGLRNHGVPDIILGMRGERYLDREGIIYLQDKVYIIDGYQRVTAALRLLGQDPDFVPRVGAKIHFGTDHQMERELFDKLNLEQTTLSSNVTLRNRRKESTVIAALLSLCSDKSFVMVDKVCWGQNMRRGDLISAVTYIKVAAMLHSHAGPGRSNSAVELVKGLEKINSNVGIRKLTGNVRKFFEIVDACWGIRRVYFRGGATYLKSSFLIQLARVFSDHAIFWKDDVLTLQDSDIKKLQSFPIDDPEVMRLASSSGTAGELLYQLLIGHINSGRRSRRLDPRRSYRDRPALEPSDGNGEGEE